MNTTLQCPNSESTGTRDFPTPEVSDEPASDRDRTLTEILFEMRDDEPAVRSCHAIEITAGSLTGTFTPGYLGDLRQDWPE